MIESVEKSEEIRGTNMTKKYKISAFILSIPMILIAIMVLLLVSAHMIEKANPQTLMLQNSYDLCKLCTHFLFFYGWILCLASSIIGTILSTKTEKDSYLLTIIGSVEINMFIVWTIAMLSYFIDKITP